MGFDIKSDLDRSGRMGKFDSFIGGSSMGFPEADTPLKLLFSASTESFV